MEVWRPLAWTLVASAVLCAARAWAADPIELVYLRSGKADVCPDKATLEKAVGKRLGYNPFFAVADRKLVAEISSKGGVLYARATLVDQAGVVRGNRQLSAPTGDCAELISSLALAISITLDPMSSGIPEAAPPSANSNALSAATADHGTETPAARNVSSEPSGNGSAAPPPSPIQSTGAGADAPSAAVSPARQTKLAASLGIVAAMGALPQPSPGVRIGFEAVRGIGALGIEATGTTAVSQPGEASSYADVSLLFGSVVPCVIVGRLGGCAVLSLGRFQGEGQNVQAPRTESHFYASAGLRIIVLLPLTGPLNLRFYLGSGATLTRPSFELAGAEVWRPPPFSVEAAGALSFYFL